MAITLNGTTGITTPDISSTTSTLGALTQALDLGSTGQIVFPATQNASSNANTLDDYEEGTWDFAISFGDGTTGISYVTKAGSYTKIGNMVTIRGYMELSNKGSSAGQAEITGLPFVVTSNNNNHTACAVALNTVSFADWPFAWAAPNSTKIILSESTNAGVRTNLDNTNFANNSWVMVSCSYYTS